VKHFSEDRYTAIFNPQSGFFARVEDKGSPEPFWSMHGPELLDVAITNWCDKECFFCYRKSDRTGINMALGDYREVMRQARETHVFQVALGGGNPNQHPDFVEILRCTREDYGIVPNYTTNGRGLTKEIVEATIRYVGAVAVSAYAPYAETRAAVETLCNRGIITNIHFVLTSQSVGTAIEWLANPPDFLRAVNAVVFLNYKPVGRRADESLLLNRSDRVEEFFELATSGTHFFRVGFDSCSVTGVARYGKAPAISLEGCDAGRFSLFISERLQVFPCSLMVEASRIGVSLRDASLHEIWVNDSSMLDMRAQHKAGGCHDCSTRSLCLSGCPLFPSMNLCPCAGRH
jgi:radical SAM protein with 4Fe4S-binding SPASM domain